MLRILVVDDQYSADNLTDVAEDLEVQIDIARTSREATDLLLSKDLQMPDLILMDGILDPNRIPVRDTEMLVRWLRRRGYPGPMIAISSDRNLSQKLLNAGCSGIWIKEQSLDLLKIWIRQNTVAP